MTLATRLARLRREVRPMATPADVAAALGRLHASYTDDHELLVEERRDGLALHALRDESAEVVRLAVGVYARIPTRDGRVRLLRRLRNAATKAVVIQVLISDEASHVGRAVIDAPRFALRRLGVPVPECGDRYARDYQHCFFDEEELFGECAEAGLTVTARAGLTFTLRAQEPDSPRVAEDPDAFASELARVARLLAEAERGRARPPAEVLAAMRALGVATGRARGPIGRARLRRAIGWVDAVGPGGASCYRRILLESALDAGAARETVVFGLDVGRTGHVAFLGREDRTFDVSFAIHGKPA